MCKKFVSKYASEDKGSKKWSFDLIEHCIDWYNYILSFCTFVSKFAKCSYQIFTWKYEIMLVA